MWFLQEIASMRHRSWNYNINRKKRREGEKKERRKKRKEGKNERYQKIKQL